ncbi:PAS and ANTAR domain-containing protein [Mycobacterium deserti]|uniref:PAS and ANTAR domain-containing protein n=1 Tax=Mycobacterium deserti TaxID=2978347 RepID=A0ABT2MFT2_9MYCO|nr:PAS and ANTAR domain-containing protein [Mycobacterium deserti]MCT7661127.1 PAS and ANTAR domain-containing protein [Mycobacterium deserti]
MTRTDDHQMSELDTGTDGVAPGVLDKALLGGAPQRVGRFEYRYDTDTWTWSAAVARMHGYDEHVEPTTELILRHKHPDDLGMVKALLKRSSAPFSSRHRIRTVSGEIRSVVVVGEIVTDDAGEVIATRGFYIDVTKSVSDEVQHELGAKLNAVVADRAVIEQAKGMLMATYDVDADAAFEILRWRSQELNIKLHDIAKELVTTLPSLLSCSRGPVDHFLMTLVAD